VAGTTLLRPLQPARIVLVNHELLIFTFLDLNQLLSPPPRDTVGQYQAKNRQTGIIAKITDSGIASLRLEAVTKKLKE
jgi:hypothetical protein